MSTTVSPTSDRSSAVQGRTAEREPSKFLRLSMAADGHRDVAYSFAPIMGDIAGEAPFWESLSKKLSDVRELGAMTMRFTSEEEVETTLCTCKATCNTIRVGIWRAIQELLPEYEPSDISPSVVYHEGPLGSAGRRDIIDLVFPASIEGTAYLEILRKFAKLIIDESDGNSQRTYALQGSTTSLPGSTFPLDCYGLPIDALDPQSLFEALEALTYPAGLLLGFGKLEVDSEKWGIIDQYSGIIRMYLKLSDENISLPWLEFVQLLPSRFQCNGVAYSLHYRGCCLHTKDVVSRNFSVSLVEVNESNGHASKKRNDSSKDGPQASTSAKKQRRSDA